MLLLVLVLVLVLVLAACGDAATRGDASLADASLADASLADASIADASLADAVLADDASADAGVFDDAGVLDDAGVMPPRCPELGAATALGNITERGLIELSGIVVGRVNPDVFWAHNDSFAELYAIDRATLALRAHYVLVRANGDAYGEGDVEDIAIRPVSSGAELFLGDIGSGHPDLLLHIYRALEPVLTATVVDGVLEAEVMDVGPLGLQNAESLLVDPASGALVVLQKDRTPLACELGAFAADTVARPDCATPIPMIENPSGADVSPDGAYVAVRNEDLAYIFLRPAGEPLVAAFSGTACPFATIATRTDSDECNGEAIAFTPDGLGLITASERGGCATTNVHSYTVTP